LSGFGQFGDRRNDPFDDRSLRVSQRFSLLSGKRADWQGKLEGRIVAQTFTNFSLYRREAPIGLRGHPHKSRKGFDASVFDRVITRAKVDH
jgi:hypothetical protein